MCYFVEKSIEAQGDGLLAPSFDSGWNGDANKMLQIAICDDENYELQRIKKMLERIADKLGIPAVITAFDSSQMILSVIAAKPDAFDILFLDMYIDEKIGLDIARSVRAKNQACSIIFLTAFPDKMADSFEFRASAYLVKPVDEEKLTAALRTALSHLQVIPSFYLRVKEMDYSIPFADIVYIESRLKELHLFCNDQPEAIAFPGKLSALTGLPQEYFHFCHKSYLVNFSFVKIIDKKSHEIVLKNGVRLPISRTFYATVLQNFTTFHAKKRGL